jgi:hypothetical protein
MSPRHISTDMLWNTAINTDTYRGSAEKYQATILEQYKLCVEMADRISARRALANAFFLTLNSVLITSAGTGRIALAHCPRGWLAIGLVGALAQCGTWVLLLRSYRQLNSTKFGVIAALEQRLPAAPFSRAEWQSLGSGRSWRTHLPLTRVERWLPVLFAVGYLAGYTSLF